LQAAPLGPRERRQGIVDYQIEQVSERREGQPGFRARRRARQYPPPACGRDVEGSPPERGLPHAHFALEHNRPRPLIRILDCVQQRPELAITRDQLFRRSSPLYVLPRRLTPH
ncbi:MAG: hypothetical protein WAN22_26865, partial [Solirubrobacteraceae bacterium]